MEVTEVNREVTEAMDSNQEVTEAMDSNQEIMVATAEATVVNNSRLVCHVRLLRRRLSPYQ
jgi:hypothetical protein